VVVSESQSAARILVVDDEQGLLFLMSDVLRREGYDIVGFDTGADALEWLAQQTPDLLVLDMKLGDVSAPTLLQKLREQGRRPPFIIVTGHGDERTAVEMMKQGAIDYVMKDAGMLELLPGIVARALDVAERERHLAEAHAAIRRREERHQKIIHTATDGFARFNRRGQLLEVNGALCELLGYTPEELLQRTLADPDGPFNGEVAERVQHLAANGFARCFTSLTRGDKRAVEVEISMRADDGEVFCFVHDLSGQRRLEREVLEISEDERRRFGRELHDGLGQQLTALELMSHTLVRELKLAGSPIAKSAEEISKHTRRAITQTRRLAHGLAPVALEAEGLMAALNDLMQLTRAAGMDCEFECDRPVQVNDPAAATHLFRIAQEAVNNALKHAKADQIVLHLQETTAGVELSIEDNGRGLPQAGSPKPGIGLQVMQYRTRLIGGTLRVESKPRKGVRIVCAWPKRS
jgi:PAS domain S-box-containing protein